MINQFNVGDIVNLGTPNDAYWIIIHMDNLNYVMKPINNMEVHSTIKMAITFIDKHWVCC